MTAPKRPIICATILIALLVLPACNRESKPAAAHGEATASSTHLQHFEGRINTNDQTYDHAKSDLYVRASRALEAGDAKTAESLYREAINKYPDDPSGYSSLGACLFFQEKYEDSEAEYLRALKLEPKSVAVLYGLGCVADKKKQYAQARDYLEQALAINEKHYPSHRVLGMVYDDMGDRAKAIAHFERAIELDPEIGQDEYVRSRLPRTEEIKKANSRLKLARSLCNNNGQSSLASGLSASNETLQPTPTRE
jgi:tetratricopeptide (TPR) repeat protein